MLKPVKSNISDLQGNLAKTTVGRKYSVEEVIDRAEKREVKRIITQLSKGKNSFAVR